MKKKILILSIICFSVHNFPLHSSCDNLAKDQNLSLSTSSISSLSIEEQESQERRKRLESIWGHFPYDKKEKVKIPINNSSKSGKKKTKQRTTLWLVKKDGHTRLLEAS